VVVPSNNDGRIISQSDVDRIAYEINQMMGDRKNPVITRASQGTNGLEDESRASRSSLHQLAGMTSSQDLIQRA
jgi:hypothetical protein